MWRIVKLEIKYFKWLYILSILFLIVVNFGLTIDERWIEAQSDFPGLRIIWLGIGIVVLFFALLFNRKSGRLRAKMLLPVSSSQVSFARLFAFILFWAVLSLILVIFYLINFSSFPDKNWLVNLLSITGIVFLINSIPLLYSDFYSTYFKKREKIVMGLFWSILWIIYILLNTIFMTYLDFISPTFFSEARDTLTEIYFTNGVMITNLVLGSGMFFLSIATFKKRKLYLE